MKTKQENQMEWLQNEIKKDQEELNREKLQFINRIKNLNKEDIVKENKKISLWDRIKIVLKIH